MVVRVSVQVTQNHGVEMFVPGVEMFVCVAAWIVAEVRGSQLDQSDSKTARAGATSNRTCSHPLHPNLLIAAYEQKRDHRRT